MLQLLEAEYRPGLNVEEAGALAQRCMRLAKLSHSDTKNSVTASSADVCEILVTVLEAACADLRVVQGSKLH